MKSKLRCLHCFESAALQVSSRQGGGECLLYFGETGLGISRNYVSICYLAKNLKFAPKTSIGLLTQVLKFVLNDSFLNESLVLFRN